MCRYVYTCKYIRTHICIDVYMHICLCVYIISSRHVYMYIHTYQSTAICHQSRISSHVREITFLTNKQNTFFTERLFNVE